MTPLLGLFAKRQNGRRLTLMAMNMKNRIYMARIKQLTMMRTIPTTPMKPSLSMICMKIISIAIIDR